MEKKTFATVKEEAEARRHNSNLENLASASSMITEEVDRLNSRLKELAALQSEIDTAGNDPNLTYETVRGLYGRAFERKYTGNSK